MDSEPGRSLILWTVRLSVGLYAAAVWHHWFVRGGHAGRRFAGLWGTSWLFCVIHVLFAFHFEHHWSWTAALRHTAEMTERVVDIHWDGGLYVNFVFLAWWAADVFGMILGKQRRSSKAMQAVAAFMMFNATVVFGPAWWWIPLIAWLVLLAVSFGLRSQNTSDSPEFPVNDGSELTSE